MKNVKACSDNIKRFFGRVDAFFQKHTVAAYLLYSVFLCLVVEILCRRSLIEGLLYIFKNPHFFLYNTLIILLTLSISMLFSNRYLLIGVVSALWLALGITNFVVLGYRITPIGFIDIALLDSFWGIMWIYLSVWQFILICVAILLFIFVCVWAWRRLPRSKVRYLKTVPVVVAILALTLITTAYANSHDVLPDDFGNLAEDYEQYGFAYCFSRSVIDRGVERPNDYSEQYIKELKAELGEDEILSDLRPNVIFLQLEAFFDAKYLKDISFSSDPTPVFTELKRSCLNGLLTVPSLGAGTANTEFEILTGMNISHFGAGEYPYKTVLSRQPCESMAFLFRDLGYSSHAIHNHSGSFYDRNEIYRALGFDTYTSLEYMQNYEENPLGWAKDAILTSQILAALNSTEGSDFVYAVSVQGHGKYPREVIDETQKIKLEGFEDEREDCAFEYFVNQINGTDAFVGALISALSQIEEPTMVVLFGDHLPGLEIDDEDLSKGNIFTTEYVVWTNYENDFGKEGDAVEAYQLSSTVFELLGYKIGNTHKLHFQRESYSEGQYQEKLRAIEYDILYGEGYIYGSEDAYNRTDIKMGICDIKINSTSVIGEELYIHGEGFTEFSVVYVNKKKTDTEFISIDTLKISLPKKDAELSVAQVGTDGIALSFSSAYSFWRQEK